MYWSMKLGDTCRAAALLSKLPLMLSSGSQALGVDVEPEQIADGVLVLAAIEATQRHASGAAATVPRVDLVLEPRDERGRGLTVRAPRAGRRHQTAAQLADHLLGNLGVLAGRVEIQLGQRQAARLHPVVVAGDAVLIDERTLRGDGHRRGA